MDPIWRVITLMCVTWVWCSDICRGAIRDRHESINMQRFFKVKVVNGACIEWTFSTYILILGIEQQHTPEPRLLTYHRSDIRATFGKQWSQSKTNNAINIDILLICISAGISNSVIMSKYFYFWSYCHFIFFPRAPVRAKNNKYWESPQTYSQPNRIWHLREAVERGGLVKPWG